MQFFVEAFRRSAEIQSHWGITTFKGNVYQSWLYVGKVKLCILENTSINNVYSVSLLRLNIFNLTDDMGVLSFEK
jgi:hypothetical protein